MIPLPLGRRGHLGVFKQAAWETPGAATDYTRFISESLAPDLEQIQEGNILQGVMYKGRSYPGLRRHNGGVLMDAHPNITGFWFLSGVGPVTTTVLEASVRWQHAFAWRSAEFHADCFAQPLTLELHKDLGQAFRFSDAVVNGWELRWGIGQKIVAVEPTFIAKSMSRITATSPTFPATEPFRWHHALVTLPDPTAFARMIDMRVNVNWNLEGKAYIDGTREIDRIHFTDTDPVVTISGRMLGISTEWDAYDLSTLRFLKVDWTGPVLGAGNYKLMLEAKKMLYTSYKPHITGGGEVEVDFEAIAEYDAATAGTPLAMTLQNSKASY